MKLNITSSEKQYNKNQQQQEFHLRSVKGELAIFVLFAQLYERLNSKQQCAIIRIIRLGWNLDFSLPQCLYVGLLQQTLPFLFCFPILFSIYLELLSVQESCSKLVSVKMIIWNKNSYQGQSWANIFHRKQEVLADKYEIGNTYFSIQIKKELQRSQLTVMVATFFSG